ncbi:hypothetical protein [Xanthomonas oryzae]|uniref:hypothetical protein n=1 Tax=Xanthomonas oryzae TaxID=347 RepID=UPI0023D9062C|nr:hypothetical protein [Xanthomonas oryzae]MDI9071934.1 hypothetical protein [Xanthomonas oryzae pv. oryzae]MDI9078461.1 hypothetical protein [Xanthomonas oryzae pv. oryzae]MDI9104435.1 hypothetical protein [Xanthomonas oryzae pv. oryzae]MDI9909932.1 hypothetical protein [Xanthomonas oryzae pv. oryzae]WEK97689.1 hypothetical protein NO460_19570 [Xanthomonas oryzae pv. oryzae]
MKMYEVAPSWTFSLGLGLAATIGGFGVYFLYKNKRNTSDNTPFLYGGIAGAILSVISVAMIWSAFKGMAELP